MKEVKEKKPRPRWVWKRDHHKQTCKCENINFPHQRGTDGCVESANPRKLVYPKHRAGAWSCRRGKIPACARFRKRGPDQVILDAMDYEAGR